ncbi:hypothetical protein LUZ60_008533 [Juncus effusus]|nr:hypothetical protein LUZ60_008533 [Juncus effusus]
MRLHFASSWTPPVHRRFHCNVSESSQLPPLRTPNSHSVSAPKPPPSVPIPLKQKPSPLLYKPPTTAPPPESSAPPFVNLFNTLTHKVEQKHEEQEAVEQTNLVSVEYYDPKPGDLVVGVVLSGNESKLDISVGADMLGSMLAKEALPFCKEEMSLLVCEEEEEGFNGGTGRIGIVRDEEGFREKEEGERRTVEAGTVVFAEVLGRTLSGRPLLSGRRLYRQIAWHRVRQIMQLNEPIEVVIFEWNTGGLLTRIEGIRAFLPKTELVNRANSFTDLKNNVGKKMQVHITRIDEATNVLIISERSAWDMKYLKPGTLLKGTVNKLFSYGAEIKIMDTNRSGLLHVSNISKERVSSVNEILKINEEIKVLVIKSMFADKIYLSIAELESRPGLFLLNKEKVYEEAEEMARQYRKRIPDFPGELKNRENDSIQVPVETRPFDNEASLYSNWKWFKFDQSDEISNEQSL